MRKRLCYTTWLCIFLYLALPLRAQEEYIEPPAKELTSFPFFQLSGGIILVQATIDASKDTLSFIMDTGSSGISLDSTTCTSLGLVSVHSDTTIRGIGGIRTVDFTNNHTLHFPGLKVDSLNFHINDYDLLTTVYGIKIDGIIGYSFFKRYIVTVDFDSSVVKVFSKGSFRYPRGGHLLHPVISNLPVLPLKLRDNRDVNSRFYFDTGAGLCLLLSSEFAEDSAFMRKKRKKFITQVEGMGGKVQIELTTVKEVKIGPYRFRWVPAYIFDDVGGVISYPYLGGVLGNDLLRRFNMVINYGKREIHIRPNGRFNEPFDYSYTGMFMYYIDGEIQAVDIIPGSPADEAGFKSGDIIVSVENNFSNNIMAYKNLIQNANETIKVIVMRNKALILLTLKVKSIR
jgi:Aspartyl protease/PDZ domain